jgi:glucosamine--fructose-6-phosphate aminotransferase (isomerizing)
MYPSMDAADTARILRSKERKPAEDFPHDMLREIFEQPRAIADTLAHYLNQGEFVEDIFAPARHWLNAHDEIVIAASGSSRHAGLAAEIMIEDLSGIAVDVEYASEYAGRSTLAHKNAALAVVSQSGETGDTLAALRKGIESGRGTLAITNVARSSMAREANVSFPTCAGVEKAIPATKSFVTQLAVLYLLALFAARERGRLDGTTIAAKLAGLNSLPDLLSSQLTRWAQEIEKIAASYSEAATFLYLGRGVHYAIAREGALKLKESSYLHAEGYPAGELKHGPNALVSDSVPLVVLATVDRADSQSVLRYDKTVHLLRDMKEQGARVFAVINRGDDEVRGLVANAVEVDEAAEHLLPLCEVVPLQLFAYFSAVQRGIDVDRPRNLVKSVVTE